nr:hypothetical protein B0A51_10098 [Rachicladosporium sp. CCFEE 5018]
MFNQGLLLPEELLRFWHVHRVEALIVAGLVLLAVRLALHWRSKRVNAAKIADGTTTAELAPTPVITSRHVEDVKHALPSNAPARPKPGPKRVTGLRKAKPRNVQERTSLVRPIVFYYSLGGSTRSYATQLAALLSQPKGAVETAPVEVLDLTEIDYDDYFISPPEHTATGRSISYFYLLLIPSYDIDTELSNFLTHLEETHHDFRIDTAPLSGLAGYSIFGLGDQQEWPTERDGFCSQAIEVDKWMAKLTGRKRAFPVGLADMRGSPEVKLEDWAAGVASMANDLATGTGFGEGVSGSGNAVESGDEDEDAVLDDTEAKDDREGDVEDIGGRSPIPVDFTTTPRTKPTSPSAPKAMVPVSSPTYTSLTKQGYSIVGTHSGVKICRWTKSALRGRGSCYKYSFYGIASHRCMEATPSLSCSNKCVFCWRHGTNPVGTTWRWQVDEPELIFDGIKENHYKKIKMMKGVPGVRAERFSEAMQIRHCALSLVGEPIFYPHINKLLAMLHAEHISSFLVCNAQHPDELAALGPATQLYVSIDASNKESLRKIDRPLHRDFWERFQRCLDILHTKRNTHRTVFRLTLVKGFNVNKEAEGYAALVDRARPSFVEVKGVTYCGTSTAAGAGLTMQNVPFYEEVCAFVLALEAALKRRGLDYGIGAEHAHSCCILLADRERYYLPSGPSGERRWHTLIDYAKFFQLLESGDAFGPEDYIGDATPEWASWGKGGFDPRDERVDRKGKPKDILEELPSAVMIREAEVTG